MTEAADVRHGVFLLPDGRTSAAVTRITTYLRAQFGLASAGRFPPHVTLAGSLPLAVTEAEFLTAVRGVASRHQPVSVVNAGPQQLWGSVLAFNVHEDGTGGTNAALVDLAVDVMEAVRPLLASSRHLAADLYDRADWYGHLSLASHELLDRPELLGVIDQFVHELDEPFPTQFEAARLGVFRFGHPDWSGAWWTDFSWELVELVDLASSHAR